MMSSNKKNAESIASSITILVDFDGAILTDGVCQWRSGHERLVDPFSLNLA